MAAVVAGHGAGVPVRRAALGRRRDPDLPVLHLREAPLEEQAQFGKGAIEGVAGPEAANNASFSGVLVPLLTLGIPTSATAAVLLAAFQIFDLQPGPLLFENSAALVWALIASLYVGNVLLLVLNLPLIQIWVKILQIPRPVLYSGILVFATLGVYAATSSLLDVFVAYGSASSASSCADMTSRSRRSSSA